MSEVIDLTEVQREARARAEAFGSLVRWPGGYWTYPGCTASHSYTGARGETIVVPLWHVGVGTVMRLERLGLLKKTASHDVVVPA